MHLYQNRNALQIQTSGRRRITQPNLIFSIILYCHENLSLKVRDRQRLRLIAYKLIDKYSCPALKDEHYGP